MKAFSQEMMKSGESYALPVKLVLQDGSISPMENTGTFVILAESIIEFSAPMFVGAPSLKLINSQNLPKRIHNIR